MNYAHDGQSALSTFTPGARRAEQTDRRRDVTHQQGSQCDARQRQHDPLVGKIRPAVSLGSKTIANGRYTLLQHNQRCFGAQTKPAQTRTTNYKIALLTNLVLCCKITLTIKRTPRATANSRGVGPKDGSPMSKINSTTESARDLQTPGAELWRHDLCVYFLKHPCELEVFKAQEDACQTDAELEDLVYQTWCDLIPAYIRYSNRGPVTREDRKYRSLVATSRYYAGV